MFIEGPGPKIVRDRPKKEVSAKELPSVIVDPSYLKETEPSIENSVLEYIRKNEGSAEAEPSVIVSEDLLEEGRKFDINKAIEEVLVEDTKVVSMEDINSISPRDSGLAEQNITESFNSENKKLHDELPPKGKKMTERIFDVIHKIPGINRIVGKLEIAYNQSKADKNREVNVGLKDQMEKLSREIAVLEGTKKEMNDLTLQFEKQGSGLESVVLSLSVKVNDLDTRRNNLLEKKENIQSEFEERENKIKLHTAEINRVADTLIEKYNKSIEPLKKELDSLQLVEDKISLDESVSDALHEEQKKRLDSISAKGIELKAVLVKTGMSEKEIQNFGAMKSLEKLVVEGNAKIDKEKANLDKQRTNTIEKIEKTKGKAGVYQSKIEEFERLKNNLPILIESPVYLVRDEDIIAEESEEPVRRENSYEADDRLDVVNYIKRWNVFLTERYGSDAENNDFVKTDNFVRDTGLNRSTKLDAKKFKNILGKYYKYARIPTFSFNDSADEFFAKKINL